ncbi:dephospho-CoA kinase [Corynebacterium breve]|uniref:Dephospho-CoA kinase n=1 Tax=Corynebacterium breve TaxID=3049799 RepID=A0ABY8VI51_9CORY|nr:dephospho-CoA kinase [Corynebacterium breve]WIM68747.1 dephospho-CoA kinase [Corynebacterium breve]
MKLIGLTGGIGSGKSTVAKMLAQDGFPVVDADKISREIVEPGSPTLSALADGFGSDILDSNGDLIRAELARRAFASEEKTQLLNSITHPAIQQRVQESFAQAEQEGAEAAIYDMPLLIEQGRHKEMDLVVVVDVAADERVKRLVEHRGLDEEDARNRIARQISDDERRAAADVIIDNNGPVEALGPQVEMLIQRINSLNVY